MKPQHGTISAIRHCEVLGIDASDETFRGVVNDIADANAGQHPARAEFLRVSTHGREIWRVQMDGVQVHVVFAPEGRAVIAVHNPKGSPASGRPGVAGPLARAPLPGPAAEPLAGSTGRSDGAVPDEGHRGA